MQSTTLTLSLGLTSAVVAPIHNTALAVHNDQQSRWRQDCFKKIRRYGFLQQHKNPGAGMDPDAIEPYTTVLKDGFMMVGCVKDAMYEAGDKFGNNKYDYKMGPVANSSIVHYVAHVPKEDREPMTPSVCFEFCRGIEDMGFFGISNGRDCYCTPYFKKMASDSSECDSVCEGDASQMCGGKTKNNVYEMHLCDTTAEDLVKVRDEAEAVELHMGEICNGIKEITDSVEFASTEMQNAFGQIGDPSASNQMQAAKETAGVYMHDAEKCIAFVEDTHKYVEKLKQTKPKDLKDYDNRKAAEDSIAHLTETNSQGSDMLEKLVTEWKKAQPQEGSDAENSVFLPAVLDQYYSIMYFIDKEFADDNEVPVTCDGDLVGIPALGMDAEQCAASCDAKVGECVGFAAYEHHEDGEPSGEGSMMCFLFSKFKTAQYYTGCEVDSKDKKDKKGGFLQQEHTHTHKTQMHTWKSLHLDQVKHTSHLNISAAKAAQCAAKAKSQSCAQARKATDPDGNDRDTCYLKENNLWVFADLPGYYGCLNACCEDYDPTRMMTGGGFTLDCQWLFDFYKGQGDAEVTDSCARGLDVGGAQPPDTKIQTVCPKSCSICDGPVEVPTTTTTPAPPIELSAQPVHLGDPVGQKDLETSIKAMCRAKLSKFSGINLTPDKSGKSKFALKELTKANRCFN